MPIVEWLFWLSAALVVYSYAGYPLVLALLARMLPDRTPPAGAAAAELPTVTIIVPAHNERHHIETKLANIRALEYPSDRLEVIVISDGSTDGTPDVVREQRDDRTVLLELPTRGGKAAALNAGLAKARHDIVVFTDASILLAPDALREIVAPFASPEIGCVSGEDRIANAGGEAAYGRYELFIRRQESRVHSIVGASGSFYAQRRALCEPFVANLAPDFLSVLRTVEGGHRAVSAPRATGTMRAVTSVGDEFERKVRTLLRGMTTLGRYARLLNPFRFGLFAFELWSHKVLRWLVPFLLAALLVTNVLLSTHSAFYAVVLALQIAFYGLALLGLTGRAPLSSALPVRISLFFTSSNAAVLAAWIKYAAGARQELWSPSRR
jgi:cellulose synthase/poly-beta-1,6-N-acetylglucosamine synthase-like glycosyltransferase